MHKYKAKGTCAREISFDLRGGKVRDVSFTWGCSGNLKALGILAEGMEAGELVAKLRGLTCGARKTSCGDQLARAVAEVLESGEAQAEAAPGSDANGAAQAGAIEPGK